jgi:hypothetical protein
MHRIAAVCLLLFTPLALAGDYARLDRTIRTPPPGLSKDAKYALLVFGRKAKLRVWLIQDGKTLYLDRNGDGDLTAKDEKFAAVEECKNIELADPDGETRYVITGIGTYEEKDPVRSHLMVNVDIKGPLSYRQYCDVAPAATPKEAPLAHFHGPLAAGPIMHNWKRAEQRCWVVIRSHEGEKSAFTPGVHPVVDIEFPSKTPGEPPIRKRYAFDKYC